MKTHHNSPTKTTKHPLLIIGFCACFAFVGLSAKITSAENAPVIAPAISPAPTLENTVGSDKIGTNTEAPKAGPEVGKVINSGLDLDTSLDTSFENEKIPEPPSAVPAAPFNQALPPEANVAIDSTDLTPAKRQLYAKDRAVIQGLDKVSTRISQFEIDLKDTVQFGNLLITPMACQASDPLDQPESVVFLQIDEKKPNELPKRIFSGWMFASSPALNSLEHPTYDVWLLECRN